MKCDVIYTFPGGFLAMNPILAGNPCTKSTGGIWRPANGWTSLLQAILGTKGLNTWTMKLGHLKQHSACFGET
jgi:hypothetical protein